MERTEVKVHPNLHTLELMELRINNTMTTMESFADCVEVLCISVTTLYPLHREGCCQELGSGLGISRFLPSYLRIK